MQAEGKQEPLRGQGAVLAGRSESAQPPADPDETPAAAETDGNVSAPRSILPERPTLLLVALVLLGGLYAGEPGFVALGALVFSAVGLARLWAWLGVWRVRVEQTLSEQRVFPNEEVVWTLRVRNAKPVPAYVHLHAPLKRHGQSLSLLMTGSSTFERDLRLPPFAIRTTTLSFRVEQRGVYEQGPITLTSPDPWGFFSIFQLGQEKGTLWVYPRLYPLEGFPLFRKASTDGAPIAHGLWENRLYPAGLREGEGRSGKDIDWRATARLQRLQFKEYEASAQRGLRVLLHADAGGAKREKVFELAVSLAGSLLWERVQAGDAVSLLTNGARSGRTGAVGAVGARHVGEFYHVLEQLASLEPQEAVSWAELLGRHGALPVGMTPVVVSAGLVPEELIAYVRRYRGWLIFAEEAFAAPSSERQAGSLSEDGLNDDLPEDEAPSQPASPSPDLPEDRTLVFTLMGERMTSRPWVSQQAAASGREEGVAS